MTDTHSMEMLPLPIPHYQNEDVARLRTIYPDLDHSFVVNDDGSTTERLELYDLPSGHSVAGDPLMAYVHAGNKIDPSEFDVPIRDRFENGESMSTARRANTNYVKTDEQIDELIARYNGHLDHMRSHYQEQRFPPAKMYRWRQWAFWQRHMGRDAVHAYREFYVLLDGSVRIDNAVSAPWWVGLAPRSYKRAASRAPRGYHRPTT